MASLSELKKGDVVDIVYLTFKTDKLRRLNNLKVEEILNCQAKFTKSNKTYTLGYSDIVLMFIRNRGI